MAKKRKRGALSILIVDDHLEQASSTALQFHGTAAAIARTPGDVTEADLQAVQLVLVDFALDEWRFDDSSSIAERPKDGVALAAVLRSHTSPDSRTAFALHSAKLDGLSGGLTVASHLHSIARLNNVEWVFSKRNTNNERPLHQQALSIARAIQRVPSPWPTDNPDRIKRVVQKLLGLKDTDWRGRAWKHVVDCHPPIHKLSPPTYGRTFIRWLLTSILPYATFLWDYRYLAARLRVTPVSLLSVLESDNALKRALAPYEYRGILNDFLGPRWWRPGIEHWLWNLAIADPFDGSGLQKLTGKLSRRLKPVAMREPLVSFNEELRAQDELVDLTDAVELSPDDWPSYAEKPWARRDLAEGNSRLSALISPLSVR